MSDLSRTERHALAEPATLAPGTRVRSEYGDGVVVDHDTRSVTYRLDNGDVINIVVGTPGYYRLKVRLRPVIKPW